MPLFNRHARIRHTVRLADGSVAVTGRHRPSAPHPGDRFFSVDGAAPPARVDLRPDLAHVQDQRQLDSCTANALAAAYELLERERIVRSLSRLFIYWNARALEHDVHHDDGVTIRDGVQAMRRHGACTEEAWPYLEGRVLERPDARAFEEAQHHVLDDAERVHIEVDAMRACLGLGMPVVFGIQLFASFEGGGDHGRIRMPRPKEEKHIGGHAMVAVGYDDGEKVFIVRNSWGTGWGDRGYCFLPYDYVGDPDYTDEAWLLRTVRRSGARRDAATQPMTDF